MSFQLASLAERTRIYIGSPVAEKDFHWVDGLTAESFAGQEWTEIEGLESIGALGVQAIPSDRTSRNVGGVPNSMTRKVGRQYRPTDVVFAAKMHKPGQAALLAAEATLAAHHFRIRFADAPAGGTPSERLIIATVGSLEERIGGPNDQPKLACALWPHQVVRVHAAEATP